MPVPKVPQPEKTAEYALEQGQKAVGRYRFVFSDNVIPASWMIPLEKGFIVVRRKDYSAGCHGMAEGDYFSYDIQYLGKVNIPCFFWMTKLSQTMLMGMRNCMYDNGYLYLVTEVNEEYFLEKWEVKE